MENTSTCQSKAAILMRNIIMKPWQNGPYVHTNLYEICSKTKQNGLWNMMLLGCCHGFQGCICWKSTWMVNHSSTNTQQKANSGNPKTSHFTWNLGGPAQWFYSWPSTFPSHQKQFHTHLQSKRSMVHYTRWKWSQFVISPRGHFCQWRDGQSKLGTLTTLGSLLLFVIFQNPIPE